MNTRVELYGVFVIVLELDCVTLPQSWAERESKCNLSYLELQWETREPMCACVFVCVCVRVCVCLGRGLDFLQSHLISACLKWLLYHLHTQTGVRQYYWIKVVYLSVIYCPAMFVKSDLLQKQYSHCNSDHTLLLNRGCGSVLIPCRCVLQSSCLVQLWEIWTEQAVLRAELSLVESLCRGPESRPAPSDPRETWRHSSGWQAC